MTAWSGPSAGTTAPSPTPRGRSFAGTARPGRCIHRRAAAQRPLGKQPDGHLGRRRRRPVPRHGPSSAAITWTKVRSEPIAPIWGSSASDVWAVGYDGQVSFQRQGPALQRTELLAAAMAGRSIRISSRPLAFRKVWGTSASDVWLGATKCGTAATVLRGTARIRPASSGTWSGTGAAAPRGPEGTASTPGAPPDSGSDFITEGSVWMMGSRRRRTYGYPRGPRQGAFFRQSENGRIGQLRLAEHTFGTCRGTPGVARDSGSSRGLGKEPERRLPRWRHGSGPALERYDDLIVRQARPRSPVTAALFAIGDRRAPISGSSATRSHSTRSLAHNPETSVRSPKS